MIEWYEGFSTLIDLDEQLGRARRLAKQGDRDGAIWDLIKGLHNVHADEGAWQRAARALFELFAESGRPREALTLGWYLLDSALIDPLLEYVPRDDRARSASGQAALGLAPQGRERSFFARAAAEHEAAGQLVHAAVAYERAGDDAAARALWSRLAQRLEAERRDAYATGLALFNLARTSEAQGEHEAAFDATVSAVHHLEQAADEFEAVGQRERAFDCFHVLIAIGELSSAFEHVLEGSVNAIRILREDNLKQHALRLYQRTLELAERAREFAAAATIAHEMTEYARAHGLGSVADHALYQQALLWEKLGASHSERRAPPELVESALSASVLAYAELGQYQAVARLYRTLQDTSSEPKKRAQYERALARVERTNIAPAAPRDPGLGPHHPPPQVWFDDLIEWEEAGSACARTSGILLDPEGIEDRTTRRSAVLGRLVALETERGTPDPGYGLEVLANHLAPIGLYAVLPALEALFLRPEPGVRVAALRALGRHSYKRSFVTLERALADSDPGVVQAGVEEIGRQHFEHAFDPLARIYRQSESGPARLAALQALGHLELREAQELLFGALEHGTLEESRTATQALSAARGTSFLEVARQVLPSASEPLKRALREVARQRGDRL